MFAVVSLTRQYEVLEGDVLAVSGSTTPLKVTAVGNLQTGSLSSLLPSEVFYEMRFLQITSPNGAYLNLGVTGTSRVPAQVPPYGNAVHIYLGEPFGRIPSERSVLATYIQRVASSDCWCLFTII